MVKKLLKYELIYYLRTFGVFWPIVLVIGVITRVFRFINDGSTITEMATGSSIFMLVVACLALIMLPTVVGIVRFYKNMYSAEGYLTFTLPVTNTQHILVKLLGFMGCYAICILTVIAAVSIAISGEIFGDILAAIAIAIDEIVSIFGIVNSIMYFIEFVLLLILSAVSGMLLYYGCITLGQTAKKNRVLMAVGVYFAYYIVTQIISTIFSIVVMILGEAGAFDGILTWFSKHPIDTIHIVLCGGILFYAAMVVLFWFVTQSIMTKKLNLE